MTMAEPLLAIRDLKTYFVSKHAEVRAVDGIDIDVQKGQIVCIVGESGCGKSMTSLSIMRLVPKPRGKIVNGEILFDGKDLLKLSDREMADMRGSEISMIFQEPMTALNPVLTIGTQIRDFDPPPRHEQAPGFGQGCRNAEICRCAARQ